MVTAMLNALTNEKRPVKCRALLDTASTSNFITEKFASSLNLPREHCSVPIEGLGEIRATSTSIVTITIQSRYNTFEKTLTFLTVPKITQQHPSQFLDKGSLPIPKNLPLADPTFYIPSEINMLIGAGPSLSLLCIGQINLSTTQGSDSFAQNTRLGWVIGGAVTACSTYGGTPLSHLSKTYISTTQALNQLSKTWAIEERSKKQHLSQEEIACETHFSKHTTRHEDGRYVVALPFNGKQHLLGDSRQQAEKRFFALEKKFKNNPHLQQEYTDIINEYLNLGHMSKIEENKQTNRGFYLPHHAVFKETSLTTKIRIVFDGSAKSTTDISLNDTLMVGPTIQDDIFSHLLRFRQHAFVLTGDIEKMYRQTWVRPEDRIYQRILWRDNTGKINSYQLNTVTFGLASAPFLAIRSLQKLADDEAKNYPLAASIVKRDIYVDDLLTGAQTLREALEIRDQLSALLRSGGLNLRQWASNDARLLDHLPEADINKKLNLDSSSEIKTLGIHWHSQEDLITYTISALPTQVTMRIIFSEIAKIFDPLGLLGPIIISGRLILQDCWRLRVNWDESLPAEIHTSWTNFSEQLNELREISYPRAAIPSETTEIQLHGFCDASERAYGAAVYLRSNNKTGNVQSFLLCSRVKVAPLKQVTLARLELCAAVLLANLYDAIRSQIRIKIKKSVLWSDSTITLHWINTQPHNLKTFVANRVAEIISKTQISDWRHVPSQDNPADALSRGQFPKDFTKNPIWRHGPHWLKEDENRWPIFNLQHPIQDEEKRKIICFANCTYLLQHPVDHNFLERYSSIEKLRRIIAYCFRFRTRNVGELKVEEINAAIRIILKLVQQTAFKQEIHDLHHQGIVRESSKIRGLSPFVDEHGILRVKGRLRHAQISREEQQPIILPKSHNVVQLIIKEQHERHFHAGIQATLYAIRKRYWIVNGRNEVRKVIRQCVRCSRISAQTASYVMGDLPKERVNEVPRPFYDVGVDYCGPFYIKEKRYRNRTRFKIYVAVFVCLATKAVHLETVSDLTTEGFIAALRRFIARRGRCNSIHSDNATNFVGANNEMKEIYAQINSSEHQDKIQRHLSKEGISWKFIPPRSPHFGGLWEAAVKSYKHHMRRIVGDTLLALDEFNTFVVEIEGILNSRPITPISSDVSDPSAITPGHFLIGDAITSIPTKNYVDIPNNRLSSWEQIQRMKQIFWKRWHKDYINGLNIRGKWTGGVHSIQEGTIVVIKEDNTQPFHWKLGRVLQTHPGADGVVRTVTLKTESGVVDRNIRKLAPLFRD